MKNIVEVEILNQKYPIRTEADPVWVREVAGYLNMRIGEIIASRSNINREQVAILTALNLAGELFRLKSDSKNYREHVERRSRELMELVEAQL